MKDIIAALEAKRAAGRSNRAQERHEAQHGRLSARLISGLVMVSALLGSSIAADAQVANWTDPRGRFHLNINASAWSPIPEDAIPRGADDVLLIEHRGQGANEANLCYVRSSSVDGAPSGLTQAQANLGVEQRSRQQIESVVDASLISLSTSRIGDVTISNFTYDRDGDRQFSRLFYLSDNDELVQVRVTCNATVPIDDAVLANITAFLNSLTISPEATP